VETDRTHRRKDVDELAEAVRQGRYTVQEAAMIEAAAAEVEAVVEAWGSPFCDGWETFRPDPAWPVPRLPAGATP
jgi:predicted homoserine dehydrogenase-like protein